MHTWTQGHPEDTDEQPIKVRTKNGTSDMVEVRNGICYEWRYKSTDTVFCKAEDVTEWRGCHGLDY